LFSDLADVTLYLSVNIYTIICFICNQFLNTGYITFYTFNVGLHIRDIFWN